MDQLIFAFFPHIHYWYEVGMLKVQAVHSTNSLALISDVSLRVRVSNRRVRAEAAMMLDAEICKAGIEDDESILLTS